VRVIGVIGPTLQQIAVPAVRKTHRSLASNLERYAYVYPTKGTNVS
jgi:hypothetical protein